MGWLKRSVGRFLLSAFDEARNREEKSGDVVSKFRALAERSENMETARELWAKNIADRIINLQDRAYKGVGVTPLDSEGTIAPGETKELSTRSYVFFRADNLIIDSGYTFGETRTGGHSYNIYCAFDLVSFEIGEEAQFHSLSGSLPGGMFAPNAFGTRLRGSEVEPGTTIKIKVKNTTDKPRRFLGAITGILLNCESENEK